MTENKCEECGHEIYLVVDGKHMTEEQLMHYDRIPKSIIWHLDHELWCTKREKRLSK
jgi:hypothetical protein